jgi:hypothetical protein
VREAPTTLSWDRAMYASSKHCILERLKARVIDAKTWVHVTHLRARLRTTNAHLAISPTFKVGDCKAFKERVRLNKLLSFGSASRVCARHG